MWNQRILVWSLYKLECEGGGGLQFLSGNEINFAVPYTYSHSSQPSKNDKWKRQFYKNRLF